MPIGSGIIPICHIHPIQIPRGLGDALDGPVGEFVVDGVDDSSLVIAEALGVAAADVEERLAHQTLRCAHGSGACHIHRVFRAAQGTPAAGTDFDLPVYGEGVGALAVVKLDAVRK